MSSGRMFWTRKTYRPSSKSTISPSSFAACAPVFIATATSWPYVSRIENQAAADTDHGSKNAVDSLHRKLDRSRDVSTPDSSDARRAMRRDRQPTHDFRSLRIAIELFRPLHTLIAASAGFRHRGPCLALSHCIALHCMAWNRNSQFACRPIFQARSKGPAGSPAAKPRTSSALRCENT